MSVMKTKSFWLATIMTLICSVAGILLAKLPYVNLIGALVLALLLGIAMQLAQTVCGQRPRPASASSRTSSFVWGSSCSVSG